VVTKDDGQWCTDSGGPGVNITRATARWTNDQTANAFENINLIAKPNRLVAIIGAVGAGKVYTYTHACVTVVETGPGGANAEKNMFVAQSSLMQAMLGELPLSAGRCSVRGVVSYASQVPWLFSGSIRQNILFDSPMDPTRYEQVNVVFAVERIVVAVIIVVVAVFYDRSSTCAR